MLLTVDMPDRQAFVGCAAVSMYVGHNWTVAGTAMPVVTRLSAFDLVPSLCLRLFASCLHMQTLGHMEGLSFVQQGD